MKIRNRLLLVVVLVVMAKTTLAQTTILGNVRPAFGAFNGWDGTGTNPGPLDIKNDFNDVINFSTNTNPQAQLDAVGNFSIGQTATTNYYGIGTTTPVLWHNGDPTSIFVGVGAGLSSPANDTLYNTLLPGGA